MIRNSYELRKKKGVGSDNKNNHRFSRNEHNETKINRVEQPTATTTIQSTRITTIRLTEQHLLTNKKQTNWLLVLHWIKLDELEITDGYSIGFKKFN